VVREGSIQVDVMSTDPRWILRLMRPGVYGWMNRWVWFLDWINRKRGAVRSRGEEREQMVAIDVYGPEILRSHLLVCMAVDTGKKNAGSCPTNMMNTCLLSLAMVFSSVFA
jgi:hypothetical protein